MELLSTLSTYYYAWAWLKLCGLSAHLGWALFALYFLIPILSWLGFIVILRLSASHKSLRKALKWGIYGLISVYLLFHLGGAIFIGLKQLDII